MVFNKIRFISRNPAKVPLVTTDYNEYDEELHETGDTGTIYGAASIGKIIIVTQQKMIIY